MIKYVKLMMSMTLIMTSEKSTVIFALKIYLEETTVEALKISYLHNRS